MATSPIYGLRSPDLDDPVDPVLDLANLRDDVEATLVAEDVSDSGWATVAITDARIGVYAAGAEPRIRVKNGVAMFVGQVTTTTAGLIDSGLTWCTIPSYARPAYQVTTVQTGSGDDRWAMVIRTNGQVTAERWGPSTSPAGVWLPFTATFLVG
jgi:hypothetical protein